jgi:uncharacterized protein with LGFP repeats
VDQPGLTRRTLLATGAAVAADGMLRPYSALARLAPTPMLAHAADLPLVSSGLQAGPGQPPIIARAAWTQGGAPPRVAPEYGKVQLAFVHHTENPDGYPPGAVAGMLRSIYEFHRFSHGWNDIGYNFAIDAFGRIWEARAGGVDEPVIGAQAGGYNAYSTGIAILGSYGAQRISPAALASLERLIAWKLSLHGAPCEGHVTVRVTRQGAVYSRFPAGAAVTLPRVAGHRDADSTDCPGDALYGQLLAARGGALRLAGTPSRLTLRTVIGPGGSASALIGSLARLDGAPLAGAPVAIQRREVSHRGERVLERTVAQAQTDASGVFNLAVTVAPQRRRTTVLRAVFVGGAQASACVSDPLELPGAVSFAPTPSPASAPS